MNFISDLFARLYCLFIENMELLSVVIKTALYGMERNTLRTKKLEGRGGGGQELIQA